MCNNSTNVWLMKFIILIITVISFTPTCAFSTDSSTLWNQFKLAKMKGTPAILPDYSYAGYAMGGQAIPNCKGKRFDVTDFGAIPNDKKSDRKAIEKAIKAAEENGGGIVFFPSGRFLVSETKGVGSGIEINGKNIVLKGAGSGPNGTEIFMRNHLQPKDPTKKYSVQKMFAFKPTKGESTNRKCTAITKDSLRETFSIKVADSSKLKPGMLVELSMNNPKANPEFLDGLECWDIWTTTIEKGVTVRGERHRIKNITGKTITFNEPIHCNIIAEHGWTVSRSDLIPGWVVEDIHFKGNWKEKFVHHKDFIHDSGWSWLSLLYGESPVVRRCKFSDCSDGVDMSACYLGTIINCSIEGNQGHASFSSGYYSYGTLIAFCVDNVSNGAFHGFGANKGTVGTVITHCKNSNRGFDWHGSWPYCSLIDNCSGGLIGNGGNYQVLPNHMRHLTIWNFNQTAGKVYQDFDWWEPRKGKQKYSGTKIVKPIIVGYHGLKTTFKPETCQIIESQGKPVKPKSLYISQLESRLGKKPEWIDKAKGQYDFYMKNGYWSSTE